MRSKNIKYTSNSRWASHIGAVRDYFSVAGVAAHPFFDLALRIFLAQSFWVSGLIKIADWQTALNLSRYEYPVSWMDPVTAAYLGISIELIAPVLLVFGFATRLAALPLLVLCLVVQLEYQALNEHVFWAVLFAWYAVRGAGPISLDHFIGRGIVDTALPFSRQLNTALAYCKTAIQPTFLLLLRLFLACLLLLGVQSQAVPDTVQSTFLHFQFAVPFFPQSGASLLIDGLTYAVAVLLVLGLIVRAASCLMGVLLLFAWSDGSVAPLLQNDYFYTLILSVILLLHGAGAIAADGVLNRISRKRFPQLYGMPAGPLDQLPHVVIVGAGFAGLTTARKLRHTACRVTLIDKHNYHLFQPLLYQIATAGLSPSDIATPIRSLMRGQANARVLYGEVRAVDKENRYVDMDGQSIYYDYLVLATGARHSYFGRDEWAPFAPGLKRIEDATAVRTRLLSTFERAENIDDPELQRKLLTFVIVGGGPTGVELAGAIVELSRHGMTGEFEKIDPATARVILVQSGARLLPPFPEKLSEVALHSLQSMGVEVMLNCRVEQIDAGGVHIGDVHVPAESVFWAAGVAASPAAQWVEGESDRAGRLVVGEDMSLPGYAEIFAVGDTALVNAWNGNPVPGLAPAAKQGGVYVASAIAAAIELRRGPPPFRYQHIGNLATIGRQSAVVDFGWIKFSGPLAWWLWGVVHILFLVGARNRLSVAMEWIWAYLTFHRSTRLITDDTDQ